MHPITPRKKTTMRTRTTLPAVAVLAIGILLGWLADTVEAPQQETCCQPVSKQDELLSL
jgi:hypothetical protein